MVEEQLAQTTPQGRNPHALFGQGGEFRFLEVGDLSDQLNILFGHPFGLSLDEAPIIDQCQLRSGTAPDFDTQDVFGEGPGLGS